LLHLEGCDTPGAYLAGLEKLKSRSGEFTQLWAGHHTHPVGVDLIDEYISCVKGILSGALPSKKMKGGKPGDLETSFGRIRITHH
jgi:hypothetical protein